MHQQALVAVQPASQSGFFAVPRLTAWLRACLRNDAGVAVPARLLLQGSLFAYALGVLARLAIHARSDALLLRGPDGHRALTSVDAYYYATAIKRAVEGALVENEHLPTVRDDLLVGVGALLAKLLPTSDLAYFLPVVLGPLALLGVLAWARVLREPRLALMSMLPVVLGYGYLGQTAPGQLSTAPFGLVIAYVSLACCAAAFTSHDGRWATAAGFLVSIASYAHAGAEQVMQLCSIGVLGAVLVAHRSRTGAQVLIALGIALAPIPVPARLALISALHVEIARVALSTRTLLVGGAVAVAITLRELSLPLPEATHVSLLLIVSCAGLVALALAHPLTLLFWPLFALGSLYAVPAAALGLAFLVDRIARKPWQLVLAIGALALPASLHAASTRVASAYHAGELASMGALHERALPGDYAIAAPALRHGLSYYAGVHTLDDAFVVHEVLHGEHPLASAKLARAAVEAHAHGDDPALMFEGRDPALFMRAIAAQPVVLNSREIYVLTSAQLRDERAFELKSVRAGGALYRVVP